ncbi:hypothetical protein ACJMK2_042376 [Sinanodonta woodiana]|uniref:Enhancer of mRNA-decapping protein 4 n=1 Tax=Sinanodonta woodiana TaxID=1069815 RepID=A0ABD3W771_SINWO
MSTCEMQQLQMNELYQRILEQQQRQYQHERETFLQMAQTAQRSINEEMTKHVEQFMFKLEHLLSQHTHQNHKQIQDMLKKTEAREELNEDLLYSTVTQAIETSVVSNLDKLVQDGIRQIVLPAVENSLKPLTEQMHQDAVDSLAATYSLLNESIDEMVFPQQTIDAVGMATGNAVSTSVQAAYSETSQSIIIPSFERATRALMHQVNDAFQNGKGELLKHLDTHLYQVRRNQLVARFPIVTELQQMTDSFQSSAETMLSHVQATIETHLKSELQSSMSGMQETIARYVKEAVRGEVSMAVKKVRDGISDSATRSESKPVIQVTPNLQEPKPQILQLLQQGQINAAFHMHSDLSIKLCGEVGLLVVLAV